MNGEAVSHKIVNLKTEVDVFLATYQTRHGQNYRWNAVLVFAGIALSLGATVAGGIFNYGKLAGIFGIGVTFVIAIQNAYTPGEKAEFYRVVATEAENLKSTMTYGLDTDQGFQRAARKLQLLRMNAATRLPRGGGMDVVSRMSKDLSLADIG